MASILLISLLLGADPVVQEPAQAPADAGAVEVVEPIFVRLGDPVEVEQLYIPRFRDDLWEFPREIAADALSLISWNNVFEIGPGTLFTVISADSWDDKVRRSTARHPRRWGGFNKVMDVAGLPVTHVGAASLLDGYGLYTDDVKLHTFSRSMLHSLILTDLTTGILKLSFDTTRPNGKSHGFPSGHTASSFAVAAVVEETYGEAYGILAYTFAGLVAWHRIDNRNHDLSDVIFGACLGTVIGKSVSSRHLERLEGVTIRSYSDPEQGLNGIEIEKQF